ncbi:MAG TPA: zinc ABC transporter substrate-binding protein, partial [Candidatus Methanofastidiosa archaeon]|nr:zinc ABC transporter substrate-binding protein [Candidatus Methanofastidiosa archaeon]
CISGDGENDNDKIGIVVSIPPYSEWASSVGGDKVTVTIIVPEGQSPHTYEPTAETMIKVSEASIWVKNGVGLEFWADEIVETNSDIDIVDISEGVDLIPTDGEDDDGDHDEGGYDAHIWMSIEVAKKGVEQIYAALVEVDPENEEYYRGNMEDYLDELSDLDQYIIDNIGADSGKMFIVFHPAWTYFARDYGLVQISIEEGGKEAGPEQIANIVDQAEEYGISVIFTEPQFSSDDAKVIANEIDGIVVSINPLASNYVENMKTVLNALVEGLV